MTDIIPLKRCSTCKNFFPATLDFFCRRRKSKDGLDRRCKQCSYSTTRARRERPEVREQERTYGKEYNRSPKGRERFDRYRIQPEKRVKRTTYMQEYHDRPEVQVQQRAYRRRPDRRAKMCVHAANRRSLERSIPGVHTIEQIQDQLKRQKYKCYYCSTKFEKRDGKYIYEIDHTFPISRSDGDEPINSIDYIVLACIKCNRSKNDRYPWEFPEGGRLL